MRQPRSAPNRDGEGTFNPPTAGKADATRDGTMEVDFEGVVQPAHCWEG